MMGMRYIALGGLLVILGAAVADVPPDIAPAVASGAGIAILALVFGRYARRFDR